VLGQHALAGQFYWELGADLGVHLRGNMRGEVAIEDDLQLFGRGFHNRRASRFGPLVGAGAVGYL